MHNRRSSGRAALVAALCFATSIAVAHAQKARRTAPAPLRDQPVGVPQVVAPFYGPNVVGVAVSDTGRIFVTFPRTIDLSPASLCELKNGRAVPYPSRADNVLDLGKQTERLVSVQGVTIDGQNRLWALDSGKIKEDPIRPGAGGAKLVCIDLATNRIVRRISIPASAAGPRAYLNDVRVDLRGGPKGTAYITDSSTEAANAIVVVDLATGTALRRLNDHPSVKAEPKFVAIVEGQPLYVRRPGQAPTYDKTGVDGLALSSDGSRLFYSPNAGRHLFSVSTRALTNARQSNETVVGTVIDHGEKGFASDGIESDAQSRLFLTDYEHDALQMRLPSGLYQTVVHDLSLVWPDSISVGRDGYLYFTSNQLNRRPQFHNGTDLRRKPYTLYRVRVPGPAPAPVRLR